MSLNGKFLDKDHLQYFWTKIKMKFASAEQGAKADTALQQSDVTSTYSASGTAPVNGAAVSDALGTLNKSSVGGAGKYISEISETDGKIDANPTTFDTSLSSSSTNSNAPTSKAVYDDQQRQETEIGAVANLGAKNLLKNTAVSTGIYTVNSDGTVTADGSAGSSNANLTICRLSASEAYALNGNILSGCPSGGSLTTYKIIIQRNSSPWNVYVSDVGNGATIANIPETECVVLIQIFSGQTVSNLKFEPMVHDASIVDSTFVPYAKTNRELTIEEAKDRAALIEQIDEGAKNKLKNSAVTQTVGEVVYTVNSDGTVSVYTTATTTASRTLTITSMDDNCYVNAGDLITGNPDTTLDVAMQYGIGSSGNIANYTPSEEYHVITVSGYVRYCLISIRSGVSISQSSPLVFKPMVCSAANYAISKSYAPYAKTNRELTVENASQQSEINYAVNTGVKNLFPYGDLAGITTNFTDKPFSLQAGDYKLSFQISATTGSYAIRVKDASNNSIFYETGSNSATTKTYDITLSVNAATITFYSSVSNNFTNIMIRPASITDPTFQPYALPNPTLTPAAIKAVDEGAKNLLNLNTDFTTYTNKGITYENNSDGTIKVSGTSSSADSYITLYDRNTDNLFGIQKGETVVIRSTSDNVSVNLIYKKSGGGYGLTVYGYKSSPGWFTVPSDFAGFLLRVGVPRNGTTVNEDVGGMICTAADWAVSQKFVPYCPTNRELYEMIQALQNNS